MARAKQGEAKLALDPDLQQANEALSKARAAAEADQAEAQRLEAAELSLDASDEDIERHVHALSVAKVRADLSRRRVAAAETAAAAVAEKAAEEKREDNLKRAIRHQLEMVGRFRAEYPAAMAGLFRLMFEANLAESAIEAAAKDLPAAAEKPDTVFWFRGFKPAHLRLQLVDDHDEVIWEGDEHNDIRSNDPERPNAKVHAFS